MNKSISLCLAMLLSACASAPPPPDWQANALASLNQFTQAYLDGNLRVADAEFSRARLELARTGRPDLLARLELVRCAVQVAALVWTPCTGYLALAMDAAAPERAYADFLRGHWQGIKVQLLPVQYQPLVAQVQHEAATPDSATPANGRLGSINDPLARLIAAGSLLQIEQLTQADSALAVDSASSQGWRRPLLAWLGVTLKQAQFSFDTAAAQRIRRRIDAVLGVE
ncbi:MAG: hypothetical protein PHH58_11055 [Rhodoferax sp.]|nr:hypothetical protein [Rhodoferax sp.]